MTPRLSGSVPGRMEVGDGKGQPHRPVHTSISGSRAGAKSESGPDSRHYLAVIRQLGRLAAAVACRVPAQRPDAGLRPAPSAGERRKRCVPGGCRRRPGRRAPPTTAETMARPSPVLPAFRDREVSARANRSKMCGRSSGAIPGPLSATSTTASPAPERRRDLDPGAGRGVGARVGEQVGQHLVQPRRGRRGPRSARRAARG